MKRFLRVCVSYSINSFIWFKLQQLEIHSSGHLVAKLAEISKSPSSVTTSTKWRIINVEIKSKIFYLPWNEFNVMSLCLPWGCLQSAECRTRNSSRRCLGPKLIWWMWWDDKTKNGLDVSLLSSVQQFTSLYFSSWDMKTLNTRSLLKFLQQSVVSKKSHQT